MRRYIDMSRFLSGSLLLVLLRATTIWLVVLLAFPVAYAGEMEWDSWIDSDWLLSTYRHLHSHPELFPIMRRKRRPIWPDTCAKPDSR